MIKFATKSGELIGLGFSDGNFARFKEEKPIYFEFSVLDLDWPGGILIYYVSENQRNQPIIKVPGIVVRIGDAIMESMRKGKLIQVPFQQGEVKGELCMFWGENEEKLRDMLSELIGPKTKITDLTALDGAHRH